MIRKPLKLSLLASLLYMGCASSNHSAAPRKLICPDTASFLSALASHAPHISLQPHDYPIASELVIQGDGITIDGNGATIVSTASHTGLIDPITNSPYTGSAILIRPTLGPTVANTGQKHGLYFNPAGNCQFLNQSAGGTFHANEFYEQAPTRDADTPEPSGATAYALYASYITPAKNITINDLNIRYASSHCDGAIFVLYAQNVTINKVTALNKPADLGAGGGPGGMGCDGSQNVTFDSCVGPCDINSNSSNHTTFINCRTDSISFEEMSRWAIVKNCILKGAGVNDILCSYITYDGCTFTEPGDNTISIRGGTNITVKNCKLSGNAWFGGDVRNSSFTNNTGKVFADFSKPNSANTIQGNK